MMLQTYYNIDSIIPKSGILQDVHKKILHRNCILLHCGRRILLLCDIKEDPDKLHRILTSEVESTLQNKHGNWVFETENTTYALRLGDDPRVGAKLYEKWHNS